MGLLFISFAFVQSMLIEFFQLRTTQVCILLCNYMGNCMDRCLIITKYLLRMNI